MTLPIRVESAHGGAVARIVLARPRANLLDSEAIGAIRAALGGCAGQPELKLVVFEGEGPNFSFGASVEEHLPGRVQTMLPAFHALFTDLEELGIPTAAAVRGQCLGGAAELVGLCGFVAVGPTARIGVPEVTLGVFPPVAAVGFRWRVGGARACQLIVSGEVLGAEQARAMGLVDVVAPDPGEAVDHWYESRLAPLSAVAVRYAWRAARRPLLRALREELPILESLYLDELMAHSDPVEGLSAFSERRPPVWSHQ